MPFTLSLIDGYPDQSFGLFGSHFKKYYNDYVDDLKVIKNQSVSGSL